MASRSKSAASEILGAEITVIQAANSIEFLRAAFEAYDAKLLFAIGRSDIDPEIYGASMSPVTHVSQTRGWGSLIYTAQADATPAQIVFTSGTEGQPKAIVLTQRNLGNVVDRLNDVMQVTDEIREYIGVPVTYSFGLGRARAVAAAEGSCFFTERFVTI
jgi:non-ribosomal peptide synthetase component F